VLFGADFIIHSGTKYLDGQGRVIAGALCGPEDLLQAKMLPIMKSGGLTLSPFNAWVVLKGLETLSVRMQAHSARALQIAKWLAEQPQVARVHYPGLPSHPQHALAMAQQNGSGGAVVSFAVKGQGADDLRARAFQVIDAAQVASITTNLGDVKTTICHPASTSHGRLSEAQRQAAGIAQGLVRYAVGLEDVDDLKADLQRGLEALS
jgi:O-succinylhomoserine sulfhydrylase